MDPETFWQLLLFISRAMREQASERERAREREESERERERQPDQGFAIEALLLENAAELLLGVRGNLLGPDLAQLVPVFIERYTENGVVMPTVLPTVGARGPGFA